MKRLSFALMFVAVAAVLLMPTVIAQEDPWWRPLSPQGQSRGVTYGTLAPSLATVGMNPAPGELWVDTNGAADGGAMLLVYNATAAAWQSPALQVGAGPIVFEGATEDAFETYLNVVDPTVGDGTFVFPNNALAADTYSIVFSLLETNAINVANSVWFDASQIIFEGLTGANAFEIILDAEDATGGDSTYRLNDNITPDVYPVMFSNYVDNSWDTTNSVWGTINSLHFEGLTANLYENAITTGDPVVADAFFTLPNNDAEGAGPNTYGLIFSVLDTNALDVANSIWMEADEIWFEGTGVDAFETVLQVQDPTIAVNTYQLMNRFGGPAVAADTYQITAVPDITETTGNLFYGNDEDAVAVAAQADDVMIVRRIFVPHAITVTHVDLLNNDLAVVSAADNTISVAIYFDADDGAQLVELLGATDDGAGAATGLYTLDITDTLLMPGWYRVGMCAQDASDNDIEVQQVQADILTLVAGGAAPSEYTSTAAAAPCVAGDPAAVTGALTQDADSLTFVLRAQ